MGYHSNELRAIGFTAAELVGLFDPEQLVRGGYSKEELKPIGAWKHDGQWQMYNQYWNCCYNLNSNSVYCEPLKMEHSNNPTASGPASFNNH